MVSESLGRRHTQQAQDLRSVDVSLMTEVVNGLDFLVVIHLEDLVPVSIMRSRSTLFKLESRTP